MSKNNEFLEYVKEVLEPFGISKVRAMFGGYGIYKSGLMFALIAENELYFKADTNAAKFFEDNGSEPFTYSGKNGIIKMSYWKVSEGVLEDQETLEIWAQMAYTAAINAKK